MDVVIRDIGNSKGLIIPTHALKEAGISEIADMQVKDNCIIVKAVAHPRANWLTAIENDPPDENAQVFMDSVDDPEILEEWTW